MTQVDFSQRDGSGIEASHTVEPDPIRLAAMIRKTRASICKEPWRYGNRNLIYDNNYANRTMARMLVNNLPTILQALDPRPVMDREYGPEINS